MGKTKTAFVGGVTEDIKSGKDSYEEKRRKREVEQIKLEGIEKSRKIDDKPKVTKKGKAQVTGVGLKGGERIKMIGADITELEAEKPSEAKEETKKTVKKPRIRSVKYRSSLSKIDKNKMYSIEDAIALIKQTSYSKFDGTMELHIKVKKDNLTASVSLPFSFGKTKKIEVADEATIEKLKTGKVDFDVLLATPDMMQKLVPFAKILGPKGLMPNPKNKTLIKDTKDAAKYSANSKVLRTEKSAPLIHTSFGKVSQKDTELKENVNAIFEALNKKMIEKVYIKATMSPSVKLQL